MEKFKKILKGLVLVAVFVSVIISMASFMEVKALGDTIGFNEHILNKFNKENETVEVVVPKSKDSNININFNGENLFVNNSFIALKGTSDVLVEIKEDYSIEYDSSLDFIKIDDRMVVKTIDSNLINNDNVSVFMNDENVEIIVGQKKVDDKTGISVVVETSEKTKENDLAFVENMINSVSLHNGKLNLTILGTQISNAWNQNILITHNLVSLSNGSDIIYMTPYNNDIVGAGFDNEINVNDVLTVYYSDIKDSETGYSPYIIKTELGNIKLLATSNELVENLFGLPITDEPLEGVEDLVIESAEESLEETNN